MSSSAPVLFVSTVYERAHKLAQILQEDVNKKYPLSGTVFNITEGRRYIKITADDNQSSVHAFIDNKTGDVYKPASWNKPAKHVRYNLLDDASYAQCLTRADWAGSYLYLR